MNQKLTPKERGLIKGALRRVFARSDLRRQAIDSAALPGHADLSRPRVKSWVRCNECKKPEAKSYCVVDHLTPLVPLDRALDEMTWDELLDRLWCDISNLQVLCETCHKLKTKVETRARRDFKRAKKKESI